MLLVHEIYKSLAVIITCHRYEHFLSEAIDSVLSQEIQPTEIIIVDDIPQCCMTQYHLTECEKILEHYQFPHIKRIETAYGDPLKARQAGFKESNSEVICFLDADDKLGVGYIKEALQYISSSASDVIYSDIQYFGDKNNKTDFPENIPTNIITLGNFLHVGCVVKRNAIEASHAFDHPPLTNYHEDWYFWRKILNAGFTIKKQPNLYHARSHEANRSNLLHSQKYNTDEGHYQTRGTAGDSITFVSFGDTNKPLVTNWPAKQTHWNIYNKDMPSWLKKPTYSFTYNPCLSDRIDIINHTLKIIATDWIFFYDERKKHPQNICETLLKKIGPKFTAIHDTNFEFLGRTMIAAPIIKDRTFASEKQLEQAIRIKYV